MNIYLAGFVPKGDEEGKTYVDWRVVFSRAINKHTKADFIDPLDRGGEFDESNFEAVFGLDCKRIKECDLLIVNGDNLGIGGSQEILIAKYFNKPVIVILPKDTTHRRSNILFKGQLIDDWIHPFLYSTCDLMVENIEELTKRKLSKVLNTKPKDLKMIDEAIVNIKKT